MKTALYYGMKLEDENENVFTVEKYWASDIDANAYKVRLGKESFYSCDLSALIYEGKFKIV